MLFVNYFTVLDFLCSLNEIDLSLPAVSVKGNIAQKIIWEFEKNDYPFDIFSQKAQENIKLCSSGNFNSSRPNENNAVIDALVDIFLLHMSNADKKILNQNHTSKDRHLLLETIKNKLLIATPITIAVFGIIYVLKGLLKR